MFTLFLIIFCDFQALDLVKQSKVAQILGEEKGSTRRGSRSSLANSEHEQQDEVSNIYKRKDNLFLIKLVAPHAVAHH